MNAKATDTTGFNVWTPVALALCWGLNWPIVKIILSAVPPFTLRWVGLGAAGLLLLAHAALQAGRRTGGRDGSGLGAVVHTLRQPWRGPWPRLLVAGLLNVAAFNLCTAFAQLSTSTARAAVLTYTMPMMAALMAWVVLGERPDRRRALALAAGAAGIALLAWPVAQRLWHGGLDAMALRGLAMPLLAAAAWAAGTVFTKRWPIAGDRAASTGWQLLIGAACGCVGAWYSGERWPAVLPWTVLAALTYHIIVATSVAYLIWFALLDRSSATVSSLTTLAVPVVGVIGAMALVGDRPGALDWLGFAFVLCGAGLVALRDGAARRAR